MIYLFALILFALYVPFELLMLLMGTFLYLILS